MSLFWPSVYLSLSVIGAWVALRVRITVLVGARGGYRERAEARRLTTLSKVVAIVCSIFAGLTALRELGLL